MAADPAQPLVTGDLIDRLARLDVDALERLSRLDLAALDRVLAGGSTPQTPPATAPSPPAPADPLASLGAAMTAAFETISRSVEGLVAATARLAPEPPQQQLPPRRRPRALQSPSDEPDEPDDPQPAPTASNAADAPVAAQAGVFRRIVGDVPRVGS